MIPMWTPLGRPAACPRRASRGRTAALVLLSAAAARAERATTTTGSDSRPAEVQVLADGEVEEMRADMIQSQAALLRRGGGADDGVEPSALARLLRSSEEVRADMMRSQAALLVGATTPEERGTLLKPVAWLHIPKTGTSFVNALLHTPAICPNMDSRRSVESSGSSHRRIWPEADWGSRSDACPGGFSDAFSSFFSASWVHQGLSQDHWSAHRGHLVTMMRQPEQRLLSEYYSKLSFENSMDVYDPVKGRYWPYSTQTPGPVEFAEVMAGCSVKQLTMDGEAPCDQMPRPTIEDTQMAIRRLEHGFVFVGITEQWDLSICLFRAMFGGGCVSSDFSNTRPTFNSSASLYDTSVLNGWTDEVDGPVFDRASALFDGLLSLYGVGQDTCASFFSSCPKVRNERPLRHEPIAGGSGAQARSPA